jgi:hypothetical protein
MSHQMTIICHRPITSAIFLFNRHTSCYLSAHAYDNILSIERRDTALFLHEIHPCWLFSNAFERNTIIGVSFYMRTLDIIRRSFFFFSRSTSSSFRFSREYHTWIFYCWSYRRHADCILCWQRKKKVILLPINVTDRKYSIE